MFEQEEVTQFRAQSSFASSYHTKQPSKASTKENQIKHTSSNNLKSNYFSLVKKQIPKQNAFSYKNSVKSPLSPPQEKKKTGCESTLLLNTSGPFVSVINIPKANKSPVNGSAKINPSMSQTKLYHSIHNKVNQIAHATSISPPR